MSDLYSLPAPSSKLLPPAGSESSDSTFFRMVSYLWPTKPHPQKYKLIWQIDALANRSSSRRRGDKKSSRSSKHKAKDADDDETSWSRKENSTLVKAAKKFPGVFFVLNYAVNIYRHSHVYTFANCKTAIQTPKGLCLRRSVGQRLPKWLVDHPKIATNNINY